MRTYCIAQGALLNALWWPKWEENLKQEWIYILLQYPTPAQAHSDCRAMIGGLWGLRSLRASWVLGDLFSP